MRKKVLILRKLAQTEILWYNIGADKPCKVRLERSDGLQMTKQIRVAVCGDLPTACNYLLKIGVVQIDRFSDATEIAEETDYHLVLIYAPQAEGLLNTVYLGGANRGLADAIPVRLLNDPCCHSALLELKSTVKQIEKQLAGNASPEQHFSMKGTVET